MRLAYLILAHGHLDHLVRIVNTLASQEATFFIHMDGRLELDYAILKSQFSDEAEVYLVEPRMRINWGGYSMVEGILKLLNAAIEHDHYDYLSLISGQDFPLKSNRSIISFLKEHPNNEFLEYYSLPDFSKNLDSSGGVDRYNYYWLIDDLGDRAHLFVAVQKKEQIGKREFPNGWKPYGGSMWFTITQSCAKYICEYIDRNMETAIFFMLTVIPDELFFPSLLLNSPFQKKIINNNLRYIDWTELKEHPKTLTMEDFADIKKSDGHFARKFDYKVDRQIVDELEKYLD